MTKPKPEKGWRLPATCLSCGGQIFVRLAPYRRLDRNGEVHRCKVVADPEFLERWGSL